MSFTSSPTDIILLVEIQVEITRPVLGSSKKSSKTDRRLKVYDFHWEHEDHLRYLMQRDNCIVGERLGRVSKVPLETRLKQYIWLSTQIEQVPITRMLSSYLNCSIEYVGSIFQSQDKFRASFAVTR